MSDKCCGCGPGCCGSTNEVDNNNKRQIVIDFMYIDLTVCDRCMGTDNSLEEAIGEVAKVLEATNVEVKVNKILVETEDQARELGFVSSPTIRVNGRDIQIDVKESLCESCGDLCGDEVDCRVWVYQGKEYTVPPKAMIIEAILREVYSGSKDEQAVREKAEVPENLKRFFATKLKKDEGDGCCSPSSGKCCC